MPLIIDKGPLPDDHPFKGTCIIFGMKRPKPVEKSSTKENPPLSPEDQNIPDGKDQQQVKGGTDGEI